jgi:hypothetical protein
MDCAFGVRLRGLPEVPFALNDCRSPLADLDWLGRGGVVTGDSFWMSDVDDHISVGWAGWASYDLDLSHADHKLDVTMQVDAGDAAVAFVFSVLPLVLPAWGLEPLHGSAVLASLGALIILGPSGAGKSSIAAALESRGFALLADDTCAFDEDLVLWPGPAAINPRWADALQPPIGEYNEKMIRAPALHSSVPVKPLAVVILNVRRGSPIRVTQRSLDERLQGILANARHGTFLLERRQGVQFRVATGLSELPVATIDLDPGRHHPDEVLTALTPWLERVGV